MCLLAYRHSLVKWNLLLRGRCSLSHLSLPWAIHLFSVLENEAANLCYPMDSNWHDLQNIPLFISFLLQKSCQKCNWAWKHCRLWLLRLTFKIQTTPALLLSDVKCLFSSNKTNPRFPKTSRHSSYKLALICKSWLWKWGSKPVLCCVNYSLFEVSECFRMNEFQQHGISWEMENSDMRMSESEDCH